MTADFDNSYEYPKVYLNSDYEKLTLSHLVSAIQADDLARVETLLEIDGVNPLSVYRDDRTVYDYAKEHGNPQIIELFEQRLEQVIESLKINELNKTAAKENLKGLNGWLILVGLSTVLVPIRLLTSYFPDYAKLFSKDGLWSKLTPPESPLYVEYFATISITELVIRVLFLLLSILLIVLYFKKHPLFPRIFIANIILYCAFVFMDGYIAMKLVPYKYHIFDKANVVEFFRAIAYGVIWIPYMLFSARVKMTFQKCAIRTDTDAPASHNSSGLAIN